MKAGKERKQKRSGHRTWPAAGRLGAALAGGLPVCGSVPAEGLAAGTASVLEAESAAAYEIYLADFLSQDPRLRSDLSLEMLHRRLNTAMDEEFGFRESADAYLFLTDGGSLVFENRQNSTSRFFWKSCAGRRPAATPWKRPGKLRRLAGHHSGIRGDGAGLRPRCAWLGGDAAPGAGGRQPGGTAERFSGVYGVRRGAGTGEGRFPGRDSDRFGLGGRANQEALETCLSQIDDAAYASGKTLRRAVEKTAGGFRLSEAAGPRLPGAGRPFLRKPLPASASASTCCFSTTQNMLEYTEKMAMYMALSEHREGTLEFLELMYRQNQ